MVPYEQADYIVMINTVGNNVNDKSRCFDIRPGEDIVVVERFPELSTKSWNLVPFGLSN